MVNISSQQGMQIKTTVIALHTCWITISKKNGQLKVLGFYKSKLYVMVYLLWKTIWQLLYDPTILHLGIYPREKKTCPCKNLFTNVQDSIMETGVRSMMEDIAGDMFVVIIVN